MSQVRTRGFTMSTRAGDAGASDDGRSAPSSGEDPPETLCCPITLLLFRDPVVISTGFTYERAAINTYWAKALHSGPRCPRTNLSVDPSKVITNWAVRAAVEKWLDDHPAYSPAGWETRELLPTPRRRSSNKSDFNETITRMREQVNEMELLARDCAREAVAARDALGAVHLYQRRAYGEFKKTAFFWLWTGGFSLSLAYWMFPVARMEDFIIASLVLILAQVLFTTWYKVAWRKNWLCRGLCPLLWEVVASRNAPDPNGRYQHAVRALFSTELVDNLQ